MNRQMRALTLQDDDERVLEDHALALRRFIRDAYGQEDRVKVYKKLLLITASRRGQPL